MLSQALLMVHCNIDARSSALQTGEGVGSDAIDVKHPVKGDIAKFIKCVPHVAMPAIGRAAAHIYPTHNTYVYLFIITAKRTCKKYNPSALPSIYYSLASIAPTPSMYSW